MTSIEIYESTGGGTTPTLKYSPDNMGNFELNKESGVMPFPIPLVDETGFTDTDVREKIDLVAISGVSCTVNMSFWISLASVTTMLDLVSNRASRSQIIQVNEWNGITANYKFYGRVASVRISQEGGTPTRLQCSLVFQVGSIVDFGDGI